MVRLNQQTQKADCDDDSNKNRRVRGGDPTQGYNVQGDRSPRNWHDLMIASGAVDEKIVEKKGSL
jgi:hypothetical protein